MSYQVAFQKAAEEDEGGNKQHCMRCHKSFDPNDDYKKNPSTACVLLTPYPFLGPHTTNAKIVDYSKFDICDPIKCKSRVLHSFTFHLRLIQEEKICRTIERQMDHQDWKERKRLEDQLEFLQKLKMRNRNDKNENTTTTTTNTTKQASSSSSSKMMTAAARNTKDSKQQRNQWKNPRRLKAIDQQYSEVMERMIQKEAEQLELETWTRQVLNPAYQKKEQQLFAKVASSPQVQRQAREKWARIEQLAKIEDADVYGDGDDDDDEYDEYDGDDTFGPKAASTRTTHASSATNAVGPLKSIRE
ncbi:MAG: hypothetical protein SGBAC_012555 [Bacillariaceae sp.]